MNEKPCPTLGAVIPALTPDADTGTVPSDQSKPNGTSGKENWLKFRAGSSFGLLGLRLLMPDPFALRTAAVSEALPPNPQTAQSSEPGAVRSMCWSTGCERVADNEPTTVEGKQFENPDVSTAVVSVAVAVMNACPGPVGTENVN